MSSSPSSSSSSKPNRNNAVAGRQRYLAKLVAFHNHRPWRGLDENDELGINFVKVTDDDERGHRPSSHIVDDSTSSSPYGIGGSKCLLPTVVLNDTEEEEGMAKENRLGRFISTKSQSPTSTPSITVATIGTSSTPNSPSTFTSTVANIQANSSPSASNSFFSVCTSRLSPSTSKCVGAIDVSPQILRRIQWQMKNRKNKHSPKGVEHPPQYQMEQQNKHHQQPVVTDVNVPAVESATVVGKSGNSNRLGFMDAARLPRFQRIRLRTRQQSLAEQGVWKPSENHSWRSTNGSELKLRGKRLETLAAVERQALQKYALTKVQKANLGCTVCRPKDSLPSGQKRHRYTRHKAHTVSVVDKKSDPNSKSSSPHGSNQQVFGVPLSQCIEYEQLMETVPHVPGVVQQQPEDQRKTNGHASQPLLAPTSSMTSSRPNFHQQQIDDQDSGGVQPRCQSLDLEEMDFLHVTRTSPQRLSGESSKSSLSDQASSDSLTLIMNPTSSKGSLDAQISKEIYKNTDRRYASSDNLIDSPLSVKPDRHSSATLNKQDSCEPHCPRVPKIVQSCTNYLKENGLATIGLFRIAGSAKRCRQLRLELDSGQEIILSDEQAEVYPHDVATLLKEYFRDLPDPLFTKELYPAFVNVAKLPEENNIEILRYLICLLPMANCDTLLILLQFLRQVAVHSYDTINDQGVSVSGNKMNSHNLATIFGPTVLRPGVSKRQLQQWNDNEAVIKVVELMIEHCDELFCIPKEILDSVYKQLQETDPDSLDTILTRMQTGSSESQGDDQEEQLMTTVYLSSQDESDPPTITKDADGTTVVRTRQQTTHRIIYKVHKPTGKILECMRDSSGSSGYSGSGSHGSCDFPDSGNVVRGGYGGGGANVLNEKFPELSLFAEESPLNNSADLIDPNLVKTQKKVTPLSRLTDAIRSGSPKK